MERLGLPGGGRSRRELLETVEAQRRELGQYQARLGDVVRAYKSLLREKAALQAGLAALAPQQGEEPEGEEPEEGGGAGSQPRPPQDAAAASSVCSEGSSSSSSGSIGATTKEALQEEEEAAAAAAGPRAASPPAPEEPCEVLQLRGQLATVTSALATVAQEKSRMEASYQADRRRVRQELEEAGGRAAREQRALEGELRAAREQLAETKARLLAQQRDRAQEQSDHADMLRELQRLLQGERAQRQEAELGLEEARGALAGSAGAADRAEGHEHRAQQLAREVEGLRGALQAAQEERSRPDPQLQELQAQAAALRSQCQAQLLQEMRKTAQAEERVQAEEQRVTSLEVQMSEVSELLGAYEKARQKDQVVIHKLKDRIVQLDLENKTLAMAAAGRSPLEAPPEDESSLDINILRERMEQLRQLAQVAAKRAQCPPPTEALSLLLELPPGGTEAGDGEKASAAYYQQELRQLKEEFERYKQRAQGLLRSRSAQELEEAQEQLAELRGKYVSLRLSGEEAEKRQREALEAHKQELSRLQQLHRQELERSRAACREQVLRVEEEMHKQRDRALAVLAEKEQELGQLRAEALPAGLPGGSSSGSPDPQGAEPLEALTQALRLTAPSEQPGLLLYREQLARKEAEVAALKKEKHRLEAEAHRLRERLLEEGERHREEAAALQGHLQKSRRDQGREGANLEYLKNIFYRFLTLTDFLGRQQTLTAILTILHFSPEERQAVLAQHAAGGGQSWWPSGKR